MRKKIFTTWQRTKNVLKTSIFLTVGILLFITLLSNLIELDYFVSLIQYNFISDTFIAALGGSLAAGNPITSYIISGELLKEGVGLVAITAFILTWVTVGIAQLPAESMLLGKKFAIVRNIFSFFSAIIIAFIINFILV